MDEMAELREHAAAQAALFNLGADEADTCGGRPQRPHQRVTRVCRSAGA